MCKYRSDLPGSCQGEQAKATALDADDERLEEFMRCAAMEAEAKGLFATPGLMTSNPRWLSGWVFVFGVNPMTGAVEFSPFGDMLAGLDVNTLVGG